MNRSYETILNLTLLHDYYSNGFTSDFLITPTATTEHLLKRNGLLFKNTEQGVLIGCDNITLATLPQILANRTLHFILSLKNKNFANFTDLPVRSGSKDSYYLNCVEEGQPPIPMEAVAFCPPVFTYTFTAAGATTDIQVEDSEGNIRIDETIAGIAGEELSIAVDFTNYSPGLYRFMVQDQPDESIYITGNPPGINVFGVAAITLPDFAGFDPEMHQAYQYQFQFNARSSVWEYYFLFSKDYIGYGFSLSDTMGGNTFVVTETPPDYQEGNRIVFASVADITYNEAPRRGIRLTISRDGSNRRFGNMPGPIISNPESKVYITI